MARVFRDFDGNEKNYRLMEKGVDYKDIDTLTSEVERKSLEFLSDLGYENPTRVDFNTLTGYFFGRGSRAGEEVNQFEADGMKFNQTYAVTRDGDCFYATIVVPEFTDFGKGAAE